MFNTSPEYNPFNSNKNLSEHMLSHFSCVRLFVTLWTDTSRLLCPWDSPGKEYWSGLSCPPLQRIFLTHGSNPHLLHLLRWQAGSLPLVAPGNLTGTCCYLTLEILIEALSTVHDPTAPESGLGTLKASYLYTALSPLSLLPTTQIY